MIYQLRFTPKAVSDMEAVEKDVLEVSGRQDTADRYVDDLLDKIKSKKEFPQSGIPLIYNNELFTGFYFVHFKKYNAFYRIQGEYIEVIRILLSKSDYMTVLFCEEHAVEEE